MLSTHVTDAKFDFKTICFYDTPPKNHPEKCYVAFSIWPNSAVGQFLRVLFLALGGFVQQNVINPKVIFSPNHIGKTYNSPSGWFECPCNCFLGQKIGQISKLGWIRCNLRPEMDFSDNFAYGIIWICFSSLILLTYIHIRMLCDVYTSSHLRIKGLWVMTYCTPAPFSLDTLITKNKLVWGNWDQLL